MTTPLATEADYELLIGPVDPADDARLGYLLDVASSTVVTVAPLLGVWYFDDWPLDPVGTPIDPGPVPSPATLVTCQTAARYMAIPDGGGGPVTMERVGLAQTHYDTTSWDITVGMLPPGWQITLKRWRMPDFASVRLFVPHPSESPWLEWWWWGLPPTDDPVVNPL